MSRVKLSNATKNEILYKSAFACCICQHKNSGIQIHHIDSDSSNNSLSNLATLCGNCHSEAHTERKLSQNLTPERVKYARDEWVCRVANVRAEIATTNFQLQVADPISRIGINWGYINHSRVSQFLDEKIRSQIPQEYFQNAVSRGVVDKLGFISGLDQKHVAGSYIHNTIYDRLPHGDDHVLHNLYSLFVDVISLHFRPYHLSDECWNVEFLETLLSPGALVFVQRAWDFNRTEDKILKIAQIRARSRKKSGVLLEFEMSSKNMFGTTSVTVSFSGTGTASAFLIVKNIERIDGDLRIECSPIAVGVGSWPMTHDAIFLSR